MARPRAEILICGAGIAGVSAAYHLAVRRGLRDVVIVDPEPPLTVTSDKSTECYRNWWPGPGDAMVRLMNRSIDWLEELARASGNAFALNRNGYAYVTAGGAGAAAMEKTAKAVSELGGGPLRILREGAEEPHPPLVPNPAPLGVDDLGDTVDGADLILDPAWIHTRFPFLTEDVTALLRPRRCGWLAAQQLGMWLLERALEHGARLVRGRVSAVATAGGRVGAVRVATRGGEDLWETGALVLAAGPHLAAVGRLLGLDLPVTCELHAKVSFTDHHGLLPRELPLLVWNDPIRLPWSDEELALLGEDPELEWLLGELPGGLHFRPEGGAGGRAVLGLWAYHTAGAREGAGSKEPRFPPSFDPLYAQVVLKGLARMVPALAVYTDRAWKPWVDGGYYCKTPENRPLIGPLPVAGAWILGALSGYGIMASQGAAEVLATRLVGERCPAWSDAFLLERYDDPAYRRLLETWDAHGGEL